MVLKRIPKFKPFKLLLTIKLNVNQFYNNMAQPTQPTKNLNSYEHL
jgi:hypothetical protein